MDISNIKIMIFDLDGTLLNTLEGATKAVNHAIVKYGFPEVRSSEVRHYINDGAEYLLKTAAKCEDKDIIHKLLIDFNIYYSRHYDAPLFPDVKAVLNELCNRRGILIALFSNKPIDIAVSQLKHQDIYQYFDFVKGDDLKTPLKPDPQVISDIVKETKTELQNVLVIGDSANDILAGKNAEVLTCYLDHDRMKNQEILALKPDYYINNIKELLDIL